MYKSSFDSSLLVCSMQNLKSSKYDRVFFTELPTQIGSDLNWHQFWWPSSCKSQNLLNISFHFTQTNTAKSKRFQLKLTTVPVNFSRLFGFSLHSSLYISLSSPTLRWRRWFRNKIIMEAFPFTYTKYRNHMTDT